MDSKYNVFKCWPLWCHHSKLLSCSFSRTLIWRAGRVQLKRNADQTLPGSYFGVKVIVLVVTDELVWVTCSFTALWSCNIHLLHDPAVVLSVWNGLQLSVTIECLSLPHAFPVLSRPVSLPPSVWISTSTSLQADYKGFNVPFTSSMFQVVCACWQNQPWHTHTRMQTLRH